MTAPFRTAVILWIAALIGSIVVIAGMTVTTDLTALLPRSADPTQELLVAQLRDGVAARLMLIAGKARCRNNWLGQSPARREASGEWLVHLCQQR